MGANYGTSQPSSQSFNPTGIVSSIIGLAGSFGLSAYNNQKAAELAKYDRLQNYLYGERAADNADQRTRALYNDFYSPEALLKQYEAAGLSPSMMFGGTPGQGGMSGAQGNGGAGMQTPYMPVSMLEAAQAANLVAQTNKTVAETKNIQEDTALKGIEKEFNTMVKNLYSIDYDILQSRIINTDGSEQSLYENSQKYKSFEEWVEAIKSMPGITDYQKSEMLSEQGQKTLRTIYMASHEFNTQLAELSYDKTNAAFQQSIVDALKDANYQNMNANSIIATLKNNVATQTLSEQQQEAWNRLLDGIAAKTNPDVKDVVIMIAMLINNALTNYKLPGVTMVP